MKALALVLGGVIGLGAAAASAQSDRGPAHVFAPGDPDWTLDVTVTAIAPDGTWGVASKPYYGPAAAAAIADCKTKYAHQIGCGHRSIAIRRGWTLLFRCGSQNVLAAGKQLADAEQAARRQETTLRATYVPDMPACVPTLTVDPDGKATSPVAVSGLDAS
jgi:hypothetical protein